MVFAIARSIPKAIPKALPQKKFRKDLTFAFRSDILSMTRLMSVSLWIPLSSLWGIGLEYHITCWTQIPHIMLDNLKKRLDNSLQMWDNVYVRWESDFGSGSVHQLESGYDWTRTQTNLKKRLDNVDKIWDNINVRVREEKFPCVNEDTEDTLSKSDAWCSP